MKQYKLKISVTMIEVQSFDPPDTSESDVAPETTSADPVARDDRQIGRLGDVAERLMRSIERKSPPAFLSRPSLPESEITLRKTFDVPAPSIEAAAALLKKFEDVGNEIGTPSQTPAPETPPYYIG